MKISSWQEEKRIRYERNQHITHDGKFLKHYEQEYSVVLYPTFSKKNRFRSLKMIFWRGIRDLTEITNIQNEIDGERIDTIYIFKNQQIPFQFDLLSCGPDGQLAFEDRVQEYRRKQKIQHYSLLEILKVTVMLCRNELKNNKTLDIPKPLIIYIFKFLEEHDILIDYNH